jgi:hypothetical protein
VDHGDADRRAHRRHTADEVASLDKVRLKFDCRHLVDLLTGVARNRTGELQAEAGIAVVFEIAGDTDLAVPSRVGVSWLGFCPNRCIAVRSSSSFCSI